MHEQTKESLSLTSDPCEKAVSRLLWTPFITGEHRTATYMDWLLRRYETKRNVTLSVEVCFNYFKETYSSYVECFIENLNYYIVGKSS